MKNILKNLFLIIFIVSAFILMITNTSDLIGAVNKGINLWATRVFPILFPFYIIGVLFLKYGVAHFIGDLLSPITKLLFKTKNITGFVFVIALMSGNPQSAVLVSELYNRKELTQKESEHLLKFCVFINPLFCLGTIGFSYFNNITIGYVILLAHILANVILGVLLRFNIKNPRPEDLSIRTSYNKMINARTKEPLGEVLTKTIQNGLNIMFLVCGFMIFFNIVIVLLIKSNIISFSYQILSNLNIINVEYDIFYAFVIGIFELVNFIDTITKTNLDLRMMVTFITVFVSFGGLSIHAQLQSVLGKVRINYLTFVTYRIFQMFISGFIAYYIFPFIYKESSTSTSSIISIDKVNQNLTLFSILMLIVLLIFLNRKRPKLETKPS